MLLYLYFYNVQVILMRKVDMAIKHSADKIRAEYFSQSLCVYYVRTAVLTIEIVY